ncbi:hypothetical protein HNQ79_003679 [Streptomyces candidus]|uniref:Uncharacterized protein n=1 Tax=Streptomyces candidus TaxID=67283 RepID=A0A7X0HGG7_9ACTN|nr:hypothetical protein [Streptomyces candidus]
MIRTLLTALGYEQPTLHYCVSCGGHYPIGHFCQ